MTTRTVPLFDADAIIRATPMPALIEALAAAFASGEYDAPSRLASAMDGASLLVMPAWRKNAFIGTKIVTVDPDRRPSISSTYWLADCASGTPVAALDGTMLTRRRTAAASALAASRLAYEGADTLTVLGTGALNAPIIEAYASVFDLRRILIWGRDGAKARAAADAARGLGFPASTVDTIAAGISEADIVTAATLASTPLIEGSMVHPGLHIDLIGAFRPDMSEADPETFAKARLFVDTHAGVLAEAGDLLQAISAGAIGADAIEADLSDLVTGRHSGRGSDRGAITLFKSVGTAIEDLAAAELVLARELQ